jgi:hypothetical protein
MQNPWLSSCLAGLATAVSVPAQSKCEDLARVLEGGIATLTQQTVRARANSEAIRAKCRRLELEANKGERGWRKAWARDGRVRRRLHQRFRELVVSFHDASMRLPPAENKARGAFAVAAIRAWARLSEPDSVAVDLRANDGQLARLLQLDHDASRRRRLLTEVADRLVATPGKSDLDVLCSVVDWSAMFHGGRGTRKKQLDAVSADLVLVFTDRNTGGVLPAKAGFYRAGRFTSRGFAPTLRDGSDQVRHFAWAFRLFALSRSADQTEQLLRLKEQADSRTRKLPLDEADLRLNKLARKIVERIRDSSELASAASYSRLISGALSSESPVK